MHLLVSYKCHSLPLRKIYADNLSEFSSQFLTVDS
jgi:hypothetical protein